MTRLFLPLLWLLLSFPSMAPSASPTALALSAKLEFPGIESVMDLIPKGIEVQKGSNWNAIAADAATAAIQTGTVGKVGKFRLKIEKVALRDQIAGQKYCVWGVPDHVQFRGEKYSYTVYSYFAADGAAELANLKPGTSATIIGTFANSSMSNVAAGHRLLLNLKDCRIVPAN